jgi:hypothetical protein
VRPELLGELILDRLRRLHEAGLVDVLNDLDADLLQAIGGVGLELQRLGRLLLGDLVGRRLDPLLLLGAQAAQVFSLTQMQLLLASCSVMERIGATS